MTESMESRDQTVSTLLAERARYEEWLRALEQKRDETPTHIYTRVHADYSARLQRVYEQLGAHRAAVDEMIGELLDRLTMLDIDEAKYRDERSEAELRGMIGEFPEEHAEEVIRRCDDAMARIAEEKADLGAEVARLREVLGGSPPALSAPRPSRRPSGADEQIVLDEDLPLDADPPAAEHPFRQGTRSDASSEQSPGSRSAGSDRAGFDELAFLKGVGDSEDQPNVDADQDAGAAPREAEPESVRDREGSGDPGSGSSGTGGRELRESVPSFLRTTPTDQVKTLKCQECGTMNYPTEWYCERCGAELAAL